MRTKLLTLFLILVSIQLLASEKLGMFVEAKRFLDTNANTKFVIDYQVPYKNMTFLIRDSGYYAELKVLIAIANADSVIYKKEFVNNIGVTAKYDVNSSNKSFLDRISLTLAKPEFKLQITFEDINGNTKLEWNYTAELLNVNDRLSDVELISMINSDTTAFSQKFLRNGKTYIPEPSGLISRNALDTLYIYCEAYNNESETSKAVMTIRKDGVSIVIKSMQIKVGKVAELLLPLNLATMEVGKYSCTIDYVDHDTKQCRSFEFIISEQTEKLYMLFTEPDDEYQLMKYLITVKSNTNWGSMSKDAKRRNISQLWVELATKLGQPVDNVLKLYKDRVDYCNINFSHFEKGWKTDMGRIYIRNGRPDDIDKDTSSDETKYVRKDIQIWKYSSRKQAVYLFVDIPMNGNFKLVYSVNDDEESTYPDWRKYVGSDFDESRLDN